MRDPIFPDDMPDDVPGDVPGGVKEPVPKLESYRNGLADRAGSRPGVWLKSRLAGQPSASAREV